MFFTIILKINAYSILKTLLYLSASHTVLIFKLLKHFWGNYQRMHACTVYTKYRIVNQCLTNIIGITLKPYIQYWQYMPTNSLLMRYSGGVFRSSTARCDLTIFYASRK